MQEKCPLFYTKFFLNSTSFLYTNSIDGKDAIAEITKKKIGWYNGYNRAFQSTICLAIESTPRVSPALIFLNHKPLLPPLEKTFLPCRFLLVRPSYIYAVNSFQFPTYEYFPIAIV